MPSVCALVLKTQMLEETYALLSKLLLKDETVELSREAQTSMVRVRNVQKRLGVKFVDTLKARLSQTVKITNWVYLRLEYRSNIDACIVISSPFEVTILNTEVQLDVDQLKIELPDGGIQPHDEPQQWKQLRRLWRLTVACGNCKARREQMVRVDTETDLSLDFRQSLAVSPSFLLRPESLKLGDRVVMLSSGEAGHVTQTARPRPGANQTECEVRIKLDIAQCNRSRLWVNLEDLKVEDPSVHSQRYRCTCPPSPRTSGEMRDMANGMIYKLKTQLAKIASGEPRSEEEEELYHSIKLYRSDKHETLEEYLRECLATAEQKSAVANIVFPRPTSQPLFEKGILKFADQKLTLTLPSARLNLQTREQVNIDVMEAELVFDWKVESEKQICLHLAEIAVMGRVDLNEVSSNLLSVCLHVVWYGQLANWLILTLRNKQTADRPFVQYKFGNEDRPAKMTVFLVDEVCH